MLAGHFCTNYATPDRASHLAGLRRRTGGAPSTSGSKPVGFLRNYTDDPGFKLTPVRAVLLHAVSLPLCARDASGLASGCRVHGPSFFSQRGTPQVAPGGTQ